MNQIDSRSIKDLLEIMARLRDPERGCPWDREQDFGSIAPYTIEEAYEVADAIDRDDLPALRDELGDLLLQVVFHARMAEELGAFDFSDVVAAICDKMVRRHPHVFGDDRIATADAQRSAWEGHKEKERQAAHPGLASAIDGVGLALPALTRAAKLGNRAARVGFDWPDADGVLDKAGEELAELAAARTAGDADAIEEEIGDLLFTVANLARHLRVDPEESLRRANRKFDSRFRLVEEAVRASGREWTGHTAAELDALWNAAKRAQRTGRR